MREDWLTIVLRGQFGALTSAGMDALAAELRPISYTSTHDWDDSRCFAVANSWLDRSHRARIVMIGYSLGANGCPYFAQAIRGQVDLIVALDPSRQSPLTYAKRGYPSRTRFQGVPPNVQKTVCYWNPGTWYYGGALLEGKNVEVKRIDMPHLSVPSSTKIRDEVKRYVENAIFKERGEA